jgi:hypothetical protein
MGIRLGEQAGFPFGNSSVATTQRYLNLDLDLKATIRDSIPV